MIIWRFVVMKYTGLQGREGTINYILGICEKGKYKDFLITGEKGSGKKYILNSLIKKLSDYENLSVFKLIGDEFIDCRAYVNTRIVDATFRINLTSFLGISVNTKARTNTKTNYLLTLLRKIPDDNIVFIINDWSNVDNNMASFIDILTKERSFFTSQTNKSYFFIISDSNCSSTFINFERIDLVKYTQKDITAYLFSNFGIKKARAKRIFNLCGSDLNLVNLLAQELEDKNTIYETTLENLIKNKIETCKDRAKKQNIASDQMEHIIVACAFCLTKFTGKEVETVTNITSNVVTDCFHISMEENLLTQENMQYNFVSKEIKNMLQTKFDCRRNIYMEYYKYLSLNKPDEYYQRALYLIKYYNTITKNAASLLVLSLLINNSQQWEIKYKKIEELIYGYNVKYITLFEGIKNFYSNYREGRGKLAVEAIRNYDFSLLNSVGNATIERAVFQNFYENNIKEQLEQAYYQLLEYVNMSLYIVEENCQTEEKLLKLKIIYTLLPYVLDDRNDINTFNLLKEEGDVLYRNLLTLPYEIKGLAYMRNVMNRKAFLFAHPQATSNYYFEAESYFESNEIWDQYCMTLISHAGTLLACGEYGYSIKLCEEALKIIAERHLIVDDIQKLYNNKIIASFLNKERSIADKSVLKKEAESTLNALNRLLTHKSNACNHVILTNMASLALYCDKFEEYSNIKSRIESSLKCEDVSNMDDKTINDFYRYHFSWYQLYRYQRNNQWDKCIDLLEKIENGVPALFKKFESMLIDKIQFFKNNFIMHRCLDGPEFCLWRKTDKSSTFIDRGLLLSDLQFTSND